MSCMRRKIWVGFPISAPSFPASLDHSSNLSVGIDMCRKVRSVSGNDDTLGSPDGGDGLEGDSVSQRCPFLGSCDVERHRRSLWG